MPYKYNEPEQQTFGPIPAGDYDFVVIEVGAVYESQNGNNVFPVKLQVGPEKAHVYDNPSQGTDKNGQPFDSIAKLLKSCGRSPGVGQEPDWNKVKGAKGRVHIKIETAQMGKLAGKEVNKVGWYIFATDIKNGSAPKTATAPKHEHKGPVDDDTEPSDIPF